ncbi:phosphatidate cytidylyltransferase [Dermacoccus barathri]|uniref:phosphatidate cytidylyltransferase n=1 Tax=Dermacoccus barathri TaxID=322601 RepID=UPI00187A9F28|nr:phosphatidate cytidylyltransferase [Dermacoccus barathri]MBE7371061.1 phosphatidate cytidylyltransferase [Dermacoccus barathri]
MPASATPPNPPPPGAGSVAAPASAPKKNKAGRDLRAAVLAALVLGGLVLVSLFVRKELFVVLATTASVIGTHELLRVMPSGHFRPSWAPTLVAAAVIPVAAYVMGPSAMLAALVGSVLVFILWGALANKDAADTAAAAFIALYVPALVSFAMMLLHAPDGVSRIIVFILVTISSDIGGYAAGVMFGKHPMAPTVSPKKSWEGFAGSWASCVVVGVLSVTLVLHAPFWVGILLGSAVVVAATAGDLCESMIKRDLGIKDMSNLIPGHGGLMDRLDSLVLAAPVTWAVLTAFAA